LSSNSESTGDKRIICAHYDIFVDQIELYLSKNARYLSQNSTDYAKRCENFLENECKNLISSATLLQAVNAGEKCEMQLAKKLNHFTRIEFQHILMWSSDFRNIYSAQPLEKFNLVERVSHVNEIIKLLSFKIESNII
jgi:hypothetical protein